MDDILLGSASFRGGEDNGGLPVHNSEHPHPVFPPQLASFEL